MKYKVHFISNWFDKKLKCSKCGSEQSVKYKVGESNYCNKCVAPFLIGGMNNG